MLMNKWNQYDINVILGLVRNVTPMLLWIQKPNIRCTKHFSTLMLRVKRERPSWRCQVS